MSEKSREILIFITAILLIILICFGIIMMLNQPEEETPSDKNSEKDFRCVGELCVSNVFLDETKEPKIVLVDIKNEGKNTIERQCIKLSTNNQAFNFCANNIESGQSLSVEFNYSDDVGVDIKDYKLEEGIDENIVVDDNIDNSISPEV